MTPCSRTSVLRRPFGANLRRWPVRAEVGVGVPLRPAVENLGERGGLSSSGWQVLLQPEQKHDVAFGGEVHNVLGATASRPGPGAHSPGFGAYPGRRSTLAVALAPLRRT